MPRTQKYCVVCQKDITGRYKKAWMEDDGLGQFIVDLDSLDGSEFEVLVGPECAKKIPHNFIMNGEP